LYRHTFVPYISTSETGYDVVAVEGGAENASTGKRKYGKSKYESTGMENVDIVSGWEGRLKMRDMKMRDQIAGVEMREKLV